MEQLEVKVPECVELTFGSWQRGDVSPRCNAHSLPISRQNPQNGLFAGPWIPARVDLGVGGVGELCRTTLVGYDDGQTLREGLRDGETKRLARAPMNESVGRRQR